MARFQAWKAWVTFKFVHTDKSVEAGVRRIALGQIENALEELRRKDKDSAEVVHGVRRRCKRLRGLIRLVRPGFPGYRRENTAIREAAAGLSGLRDASVMPETYDSLWKHTNLRPSGAARQWLVHYVARAVAQHDLPQALSRCEAQLTSVGHRASAWTVEEDGFDAVGGGLKQIYVGMSEAMETARRRPAALNFHEWRKQEKYHLQHLELMRATAPEVLSGYRECADELGDVLGDHHNLHVLAETYEHARDLPELSDDLAAIDVAIAEKTQKLERKAFELGGELAAEKPRAFVDRYAHYWQEWRV
jgi:hypothetical protein